MTTAATAAMARTRMMAARAVVLPRPHHPLSLLPTRGTQALRSNNPCGAATFASSSSAAASSDAPPPTQNPPPVFERVGVVGLGLMGHGIAQVAAVALAKHQQQATTTTTTTGVWAYEAQESFLQSGQDRIKSSLDHLVRKSKLDASQAEATWNALHFTTNIADLTQCDLVVEAVIEDLNLKHTLYQQLGQVLSRECVVASNTSSLRIADLASGYNVPSQFCGVHFFNPVQLMKLVEVIGTPQTNPSVTERVRNWATQDLAKVAVTCGDTPGFIVNRLLVPSLMQAMCMIDRGDATIQDIDLAMQLGCGHPMGPLHLSDYIGLDTCLNIVEGWVKDYPNEPNFVVPNCLRQLVQDGHCGRKSGQGFYHWDGEKRGEPVQLDLS